VEPSFRHSVAANWNQPGFPLAVILTRGISLRAVAQFHKSTIASTRFEEEGKVRVSQSKSTVNKDFFAVLAELGCAMSPALRRSRRPVQIRVTLVAEATAAFSSRPSNMRMELNESERLLPSAISQTLSMVETCSNLR
jgi:hypothetical protein